MDGKWMVMITDDEGDEHVFVAHVKKRMARVITANLMLYYPQSDARIVKW